MSKESSELVHVRVDAETMHRLRMAGHRMSLATDKDIRWSEVLRIAVREYLDKVEESK